MSVYRLFIVGFFFYCVVMICIMSYFYQGTYLPYVSEVTTSITYDETFFNGHYKNYCSNYYRNTVFRWSKNAWYYVDRGLTAELYFPTYGHNFLSCTHFPGGFDLGEKGSLNYEYYSSSRMVGAIPNIVTCHGCGVYNSVGRPFVAMPLEEMNSTYLFFCDKYSSKSTSASVTLPIPLSKDSTDIYPMLVRTIGRTVLIFVVFVPIVLIIIHYWLNRKSFITWFQTFKFTLFSLVCYIFLVRSCFFGWQFESEFVGNLYPYIPSIHFSDQYIKDLHMNLCISRNGLEDFFQCSGNLKVLTNPIYGHNYIVSTSGKLLHSVNESILKTHPMLADIEGLVTYNGYPLYLKGGRIYVQVPLEVVSSIDIYVNTKPGGFLVDKSFIGLYISGVLFCMKTIISSWC